MYNENVNMRNQEIIIIINENVKQKKTQNDKKCKKMQKNVIYSLDSILVVQQYL